MNDKPRSRFASIVAREWWVVLLAMVAAGVIAYLMTGTSSTTYVATGTVKVNQPAVSRFPTMLFGDRMLDTLDSSDFRSAVASEAGLDPEKVSDNFSATATGKLLDRIAIRYRASSAEEAKEGADALAKGVVAFAAGYNGPELARLSELVESGGAAIERAKELQQRIGDDPYKQADIELQISNLEQADITNRSVYEQAKAAYGYDGKVAVAAQAGSSRTDLLAAALLAGLVAGLIIAAIRERLQFRSAD